MDPEELFSPSGSSRETKRSMATDELMELLAEQPMPSTEVEQHFKQRGISFRTVNEAKKDLGIVSYRRGDRSWRRLPKELCNNADCTGST